MKINNIKGNTYWIRGGTNTGVYVFEDNTVLLIDPGISGERQEKIIKILEENKLTLRYILLTHEHEDHVGGIGQLRKYFGKLDVFSTKKSKVYVENPEIYMDAIVGGRRPQILVDAMNEYISGIVGSDADSRYVNNIFEGDSSIFIKGHEFKIFDCNGHTEGCVGIVTDDGVAFFGDLLITKNSLDKFNFLFMCDYKSQIISLDKLRTVKFEVGILGHSSGIFSKKEILELADYNHKVLIEKIESILKILKKPLSFDEIIASFVKQKELKCNYIAYLEYRNSLNALISYLLDSGIIGYMFDDYMLKYYIIDSCEEEPK